jgi:hypothetical protein
MNLGVVVFYHGVVTTLDRKQKKMAKNEKRDKVKNS